MLEFANNNAKNASIEYTLLKLNYRYHPYICCKKNINFSFKFKAANKLTKEFRNLIVVYKKNL